MEHRVGWLDPVFTTLSLLGQAGLVWIGLGLLIAVATRRSIVGTVAFTAACVWGADLVALGLKAVFGRQRPFETIFDPEPLVTGTVGASLPSGHAATSAAGALVLSVLVPRAAPAFVLLALGIAFSRVYVGVHFPSDVLLGAAVGAGVALAVLLLVRRPRRPEGIRPQPPRSQTGG